jgi:hypothetical protein
MRLRDTAIDEANRECESTEEPFEEEEMLPANTNTGEDVFEDHRPFRNRVPSEA